MIFNSKINPEVLVLQLTKRELEILRQLLYTLQTTDAPIAMNVPFSVERREEKL